jgi:cytochrome c oxidase subunit 4
VSPTVTDAAAGRTAHVTREVLVVFAILVILTVAELTVATSAVLPVRVVRTALVGLAVTKAGLLGFFFMHLRHEPRALRLTVLGPLLAPGIYAVLLAADAAWRQP